MNLGKVLWVNTSKWNILFRGDIQNNFAFEERKKKFAFLFCQNKAYSHGIFSCLVLLHVLLFCYKTPQTMNFTSAPIFLQCYLNLWALFCPYINLMPFPHCINFHERFSGLQIPLQRFQKTSSSECDLPLTAHLMEMGCWVLLTHGQCPSTSQRSPANLPKDSEFGNLSFPLKMLCLIREKTALLWLCELILPLPPQKVFWGLQHFGSWGDNFVLFSSKL